MAETIIIHNYAGGGGGALEEIPLGQEVSRYYHPRGQGDFTAWHWSPGVNTKPNPSIDFKEDKTYVVYELEGDQTNA